MVHEFGYLKELWMWIFFSHFLYFYSFSINVEVTRSNFDVHDSRKRTRTWSWSLQQPHKLLDLPECVSLRWRCPVKSIQRWLEWITTLTEHRDYAHFPARISIIIMRGHGAWETQKRNKSYRGCNVGTNRAGQVMFPTLVSWCLKDKVLGSVSSEIVSTPM